MAGSNVLPLRSGSHAEQIELPAVERERFDRFEETAVETQDMLPEDGGKSTGVQGLPKGLDHRLEVLQVFGEGVEKVREAVVGQKMDVFGEESENATHQKTMQRLRARVPFQRSRARFASCHATSALPVPEKSANSSME
jgi:hypothetical protein